MSDYKNASIDLISLGEIVIMDDVSKDDSVNPRSSISVSHVEDYTESIIGYLQDGKDFSKVWGQVPEVVESDEEGKYLLASGYHTVTALLNLVDKAGTAHAKKDAGDSLSDDEKVLVSLDLNFEITVRVKNLGGLSPKDAAKYHAAFSNVHGISLSPGEKSKTAYNALSVMNLTKGEDNKKFKPHINDRKLAAMIGVSKSTVYEQRQVLIQERFGVVSGNISDSIDPTKDPKDAKAVLDSLDTPDTSEDATASTPAATEPAATDAEDSSESSDESQEDPKLERQDNDGKDQKKDDRPKGSEGIDVPKGDDAATEPADAKSKRKQTMSELETAINNVLEVDANALSMSISTVSARTETGRKNMVEKLLNNNNNEMTPFIEGIDKLFSLFITALDVIATENIDNE